MRKLLPALLFCCLLATACASGNREYPMKKPQDYSAGHYAFNSLDYQGRYLAAEPVKGGISSLAIEDETYVLSYASGKTSTGGYRWDVTLTVVTLEPYGPDAGGGSGDVESGLNLSFFAGENYLKLVSGPQSGLILRKEQACSSKGNTRRISFRGKAFR